MESKSSKPKKGASRLARTLRSLVVIVSIGVVLAVYNAVSLRRDVALAIGPKSAQQEEFLKGAAERPDIQAFFKALTPEKRLRMAKNIGQYTDPELATLCGKCLDTFDAQARQALTDSLCVIATQHPEAVAKQMTLPGSFQQLAIATALRKAGSNALPLVVKELSVGDARSNAVAYLVAFGKESVAPTLPILDATDKDTRLAAADTLGKLRAMEAVPKLLSLYDSKNEEERLTYFTSLASIGDPSTEGLMSKVFNSDAYPTPLRAQAALGLGRIGTTSALSLLWKFSSSLDLTLRNGTVTALQLAGDPALEMGKKIEGIADEAMIDVAGGIISPAADAILVRGLQSRASLVRTALLAANRPSLLSALYERLKKLDPLSEGDQIDAIMRTLTTTEGGRSELQRMAKETPPTALASLATRRLSLGAG